MGNFFRQFVMLLLTPIYIRVLSQYEYGQVSLLMPIINFLPLIITLGLYSAQKRELPFLKSDNEKKEYIFSINLLIWFFSGIIILGIASSKGTEFILSFFNLEKEEYSLMLHIVFIIGVLSSFNLMADSYYSTMDNYKKIVFVGIIGLFINGGFSFYFIINCKLGAMGRLLGILLSNLSAIIIIYIPYITNAKIKFSKNVAITSLVFGVPILFDGIVVSIINFSDRIILSSHYSLEIIAIYSLAYTIGSIIKMVSLSFIKSITHNLYLGLDSYDEYKNYISNIVFTYICVIFFISCSMILFLNEITIILIPKSYHSMLLFTYIIIMAMTLNSIASILTIVIGYYRKTLVILIVNIIVAATNILLNIIYIPHYGPSAAAVTTLIAYLMSIILLKMYINRSYNRVLITYKQLFLNVFIFFNPVFILILYFNVCFIYKIVYYLIFVFLLYKYIFRKYKFVHLIRKKRVNGGTVK
jgi:O-antigen/teichoic acid export membrane protein